MVPNQAPEKEPTDEIRRERALKSVQTNLAAAVQRLNEFLPDKSRGEIIRKVHTAKTEIINDSDETEIVDYYSLWTDFADIRLTTGPNNLLRNDSEIPEKRKDVIANGFDKSDVITLHELRINTDEYTTPRILSLALQLEKFLPLETK